MPSRVLCVANPPYYGAVPLACTAGSGATELVHYSADVPTALQDESSLRRGTICLAPKLFFVLFVVTAEGFANTLEALRSVWGHQHNLIAAYSLDLRVVVFR